MAVSNYKIILKKLKKQVTDLKKREEQTKNKLKLAFKKIHQLSQAYQNKFAAKARQMKGKIAEAEVTTYAKAALHLERQLLKAIDVKSKALESAIAKIEKKRAQKLKKHHVKKRKKEIKRTSKKKPKVSSAKISRKKTKGKVIDQTTFST